MEKGNKKLMVQVIIFVVVFVVGFLGTKYVMTQFKSNGNVEKQAPK
jgi:hypothetical protein